LSEFSAVHRHVCFFCSTTANFFGRAVMQTMAGGGSAAFFLSKGLQKNRMFI